MARYIDADKLKRQYGYLDTGLTGIMPIEFVDADDVEKAPTADIVEVETIKAWLYEIAINNVGCIIDGDFSNACEEIIARLDGLRNFAKERDGEK